MAVSSTAISSRLNVTLNYGIDPETGKTLSKLKTFSNVKVDASDEDLYAVIKTLASLQKHEVMSLRKTITYDVYED